MSYTVHIVRSPYKIEIYKADAFFCLMLVFCEATHILTHIIIYYYMSSRLNTSADNE